MTIQEFAESRRFRIKRDTCGDRIIPGRFSAKDMPKIPEYTSHVYEGFNDGRLGVCLMFVSKRKWNRVREALLAAGCRLKQNADTEGCVTFDPANEKQVTAVIKAAGLKRRRVASPAQLEHLRTIRALPNAA